MVLLINSKKKMDLPLVKKALDATFKRRRTHALPTILQPPSKDWEKSYADLARQCGLSENLADAFGLLDGYFKSAFE